MEFLQFKKKKMYTEFQHIKLFYIIVYFFFFIFFLSLNFKIVLFFIETLFQIHIRPIHFNFHKVIHKKKGFTFCLLFTVLTYFLFVTSERTISTLVKVN